MLVTPRICPYPLMADGMLDYIEGNEYKTERGNGMHKDLSICIEHRVTGNNLVMELLLSDRAAFACTVIAPCCAYREIFISHESAKQNNGAVIQRQEIICDPKKVSDPINFRPHIVTKEEISAFRVEPRHGLDDIWEGELIKFPQAAILAIGPFLNPKHTTQSILRIKKDDGLPHGCFEVEESSEEGFYFCVRAAPELYDSLQYPGNAIKHCNSIYAAALAQGFQILQEKFSTDKTWKEYANLRTLYAMLKEKGLSTWDSENFSANRAVAAFHPHEVDTNSSE